MKTKKIEWPLGLILLFLIIIFSSGYRSVVHAQAVLPTPPPGAAPIPVEVHGVQIDSLDNQPITPEMKNLAKKDLAEMATKGYIGTTEDEVIGEEKYTLEKQHGSIRPMKEVEPGLKSPSATLGISFKGLKPEGGEAHGANVDGKWTAETRFFTEPGGASITLEEWDYNATGGGVIISRESINETINGNPAVLVIKESPSGKAVTTLRWFTQKKGYTLTISKNVKKDDSLLQFLDLASSIQD